MQSIQLKNLHQTQISFELNIIHTPLKFLLDGAYFSCFQLSALHFPIDAIKWARTKLIMLLSIYLCGRGQYHRQSSSSLALRKFRLALLYIINKSFRTHAKFCTSCTSRNFHFRWQKHKSLFSKISSYCK